MAIEPANRGFNGGGNVSCQLPSMDNMEELNSIAKNNTKKIIFEYRKCPTCRNRMFYDDYENGGKLNEYIWCTYCHKKYEMKDII